MSASTISGIAILGAGIFATEAHLPALVSLGKTAPPLKAIYSRSEHSAADLAKAAKDALALPSAPDVYHDAGGAATSLDALLGRADIAAVIVVLPIGLQPEIIRKAFLAGKHVLSEKPVSPTVKEGVAFIKEYEATYKPKGIHWKIAENHEVEPGHLAAAQAIRDGKIGKVTSFNLVAWNVMDKTSKWYKTPWRTTPDYQGGFLLDGGVHSVAALRTILPSPLASLVGFSALHKDYLAPHDSLQTLLRLQDGTSGIFDMSFATPTPTRKALFPDGITVTGSKGWLSVGWATRTSESGAEERVLRVKIRTVEVDAEDVIVKETEEVVDNPSVGVQAELEAFFKVLGGEDGGAGEPRNALLDVAFIEAALTSQGQAVDLQKLVDF